MRAVKVRGKHYVKFMPDCNVGHTINIYCYFRKFSTEMTLKKLIASQTSYGGD